MSILRFNNVTKSYGTAPVLREIFWSLDPGEKVGLIGANGTGKTTVLKLVLGQEQPDSGTVETDKGIRTGYFSQFSELDGESSVTEILNGLFSELHALRTELEGVEKEMENSEADLDRLIQRQAELHEILQDKGGWEIENRIATVLDKLEFPESYRACPVSALSGGWKNRAALARILLEEPDLLLLDEPTNFLDTDGVLWLEDWLSRSRCAALIVSHDRDFLNNTTRRIVEIENRRFQEYKGDFTYYIQEKQTRLRDLERQFEHEQELLICETEAIEDIRLLRKEADKGVRRKIADIRKKKEPRPVDAVFTDIYELLKIRTELGRFKDIGKSFGERRIFGGLSFEVQKEDRIVVVGQNGCGKSTLLKVLSGKEMADEGEVRWLSGSEIADFTSVFEGMDLTDTVSHAVNLAPMAEKASRKRVHKFLELMRFSEADLMKRIGALSGGLKARVALAQCLLSGSPVILLDEPTNHLDIATCQVMERALVNFPGAVIAASHDRFFIDKIATKLLVFGPDGVVTERDGTWSQWRR
jgi:ATP-binding cassette subfamily F protein 3